MGEFDLINWIRSQTISREPVLLGIGDDSAVVNASGKGQLVISTDTLLDGTHFVRETCTPEDIGRKALLSSISDIAAMGCKPVCSLVSFVLPNLITEDYCKRLYSAIIGAAELYDVQVIGGDIVSGNCHLNINITVMGFSMELMPIKRSGAKIGDVIIVTGCLGGSILGRHFSFNPRVNEGIMLNRMFDINSMIDISDGLLIDLNHILTESSVGAIIDESMLPIADDAYNLAKISKKEPVSHAMSDGEDYELLFTLSAQQADQLLQSDLFSIPLTKIGYINDGSGLLIKGLDGRVGTASLEGYEHITNLN